MYKLITRNTQFLNQDVRVENNQVLKLCGFSGSNGNLILSKEKSFLITDNRYELQAKKELKKDVEVIIANFSDWIKVFDEKISYNPWCVSIADAKNFSKNFKSEPVEIEPYKNVEVFEYLEKYAGLSSVEKLVIVQKFIKEKNLDALLLCDADSVSWLLNLRSNALPCSPVYLAFAIVPKDGEVIIFKNKKDLKPYKKIGLNPVTTPQIFAEFLKGKYVELVDPILALKASKNPVELASIEKTHIKDGVAVTKLLHWLSSNWQGKTEMDVVKKLYQFRQAQEGFFANSFDTICAMNENGAIMHYRPTSKTDKKLEDGLLLLDSGGQYLGGTTDVTRTVALGKVSQEMQDNFTLVLKSYLALCSAVFPVETLGQRLDGIARSHLWKNGLDYKHGTGHGVANFGNVHEYPVAVFTPTCQTIMKPNMVLSIEPGLYFENKYGIRIENLVKTIQNQDFLGFEELTVIPLDKSLINDYLLTEDEKKQIYSYQKRVYQTLEKYLDDNQKNWLTVYMFDDGFSCQC